MFRRNWASEHGDSARLMPSHGGYVSDGMLISEWKQTPCMPHWRLLPLLVALGVVVAGCGGVLSQPTPTEPTTPAPVPTPPSTPTPAPVLAPGLTANGIHDKHELVAAHSAVLANTSYTVRSSEVHTYANGTVRSSWSTTIRVSQTGTRVSGTRLLSGLARMSTPGHPTRTEFYQEGDRGYMAKMNATGTYYDQVTVVPPEEARSVPAILSGMSTRVTVLRRGTDTDTTLYRVNLVNVTNPHRVVTASTSFVPGQVDVGNVTFTALIDPRGVIHDYQVTFTYEISDRPFVHVIRRVKYRGLNTTTVDRPSWYDAAVANTSEA